MRFLISLILVVVTFTSAVGEQLPRPNVVLILIDDLNHYGVTAYGANRISEMVGRFEQVPISTPRIDQLAAEGLRCDNAFVYPLCEPTRIALMSGQYNCRNFLRPKAQHASDITFGDVFQRAGYATGIFGKWKQTRGTRDIPAKDYIFEFGWDEFCCFDVVGELQRYINPNLVINGTVHNYMGRKDLDPQTGRRWYGPDICNRYALDFIDRHKREPFFLYYPMLLVHDEHKPTPDTKPNTLFDYFDEATHNRDGHTGNDPRFFPDMVAYMDKLIGKVIDKLEEHGLREKTLVVVMGDNGTKELYTHLLADGSEYAGGKGGNRDNGIHVPLILSLPGAIPTGEDGKIKDYEGLVNVTDIFPTLCDAADLEIPHPAGIDGISFWSQACGTEGEPRKFIYTWYNGNSPATDFSTTLRYAFNKSFKRYAPHVNYPRGRFFDLRSDPLEMTGNRQAKVGWVHYHRSGLEVADLDAEQKGVYDQLGEIIEANSYVPVTGLQISYAEPTLKVGEMVSLKCRIIPKNATRQNVIWESSDLDVITVNKFGDLTAHAIGTAKVSVYSWDDANPQAANEPKAFSRNGLQDSIEISVVRSIDGE